MKKRLFAALMVVLMLAVCIIPTFADGNDDWGEVEIVTSPLDAMSADTAQEPAATQAPIEDIPSPVVDDPVKPEVVTENPWSKSDQEFLQDWNSAYTKNIPNPTVSEILNWATTKGNEIIYILQIISQPFAIIIFIIAAFMTLIGCIGKSDMVGKGIVGMVVAVIVYALVLYCPVIIQSAAGWLAS